LFEDLLASPPTWPKSGTWDLGAAYEHPMSAPATAVSASSSSPTLLPTPSAQLAHDSQTHRSGARTDELLLTGIALELGRGALLKTPTAQLAVNGGSQHPDKRREGGHGPTLADQVEHLLPTPAARDWKSGQSNLIGTNARPLSEVVEMLLPTPTVADSRNSRNSTAGRSPDSAGHSGTTLSDLFWTGESTPSPSVGTSAPSAAQLPGQLSLDGLESD
jgi:hypothetical protein